MVKVSQVSSKKSTKASQLSPKKNLLQRKVSKGSPKKAFFGERPCIINVIQLRQGVSIAFATAPNSPDRSAFVYPIVQNLQNNSDEAESLHIDHICFRRVPGSNNVRMPNVPGGAYGFYQFVRVFESEEESTVESNIEWGTLLAREFTDYAASNYQYPKVFRFVRNNPPQVDLPIVDTHLMNEDVVTIMDMIYPTSSYSRQDQVDNIHDDFFSFQGSAEFVLSLDEDGNPME